MNSVAAELEFTAPLSTFACLQVGPQGLPARMRPSCTWPRLQSGPDGPEALSMRLPASSALASREIRRVNSPLIRHPRPASTPGQCCHRLRQVGSTRLARSALVVSHHLDGLLRRRVPGLLHPGTGRGSPRFASAAAARRPAPPKRYWLASGRPQRSSLRPSHPSKKFSRWQPHRITATVAPSPLRLRSIHPSKLEWDEPTTLDLGALLRRWEPNTDSCCQLSKCLLLPGLRSPPGFWLTRSFRPDASPHRPG
jgi:hypothetical protein